MSDLKRRKLGVDGPAVSELGLGCMAMSDVYATPDEAEGLRTIEAALERGVTLLNTGDFYGSGRNELLLRRALAGANRDKAFVSVKTGALKSPAGDYIGFDARPAALQNFLAQTLVRLGVDYIDLYQPARADPMVPIEETVGAISDMVRKGWVRHIGLSEIGPATLRRAHAVHPIAAVEVEYSLIARDVERNVVPACRELGVGVIAYSVLAGGLLSGKVTSATIEPGSLRAHSPRFQQHNLQANVELCARFAALAARRGETPSALATAWVLAKGEDIVPLVGARKRAQLEESLAAAAITLTPGEISEIESIVPPGAARGAQYPDFVQAPINAERAKP